MTDVSAVDPTTSNLTADKTDLKSIPFLGNIAVFFGGMQRMVWSYGVLYLDLMVFSGGWAITGGTLQSTFWIMNFLVLGVLFGERALMNVVPLLTVLLQARAGNAGSNGPGS